MALDLQDFRRTAEWLIERSRKIPTNLEPQRRGAHILYRINDVADIDFPNIGFVSSPTKWARYKGFAHEKADRLVAAYERDCGSRSSWETRDFNAEQFGGAVLFPTFARGKDGVKHSFEIISVSGLDERVDESVGLIMGYHLNLITSDFNRYTSVSRNNIFAELFEAYRTERRT
ncbi:MAG: hypothetical protein ACP5NS_00780 [Candidatus Pacearchaeota archaeon]